MNQDEAVSAIHVIGAVAQADGTITHEERLAFRQALADFAPKLPDGTTVDEILEKEINLDEALANVKSPVVRKAVFEAAFAMSIVDGRATEEENDVMRKIRTAFDFSSEPSMLDQVLTDTQRLAEAGPILSPSDRAHQVNGIISQRALYAGLFGAVPLPLVSDIGVLIQINAVVEAIAVTWGQPLTRKERIAHFGALISLAVAQGAVHSLIKMIPGWGSVAGAVSGALGSYATTYAIGRAVNYHFEKEGKTTAEELRKVFTEQKVEAKKDYEANKEKIEAAKEHADDIAALTKQLEKKEITAEEFDLKMAQIVGDKT